MYLTSPVQSSG